MLDYKTVAETEPKARPSGPPAVSVRDLSFTYPDGRKALHDIDFAVHPGERVALVGPNGAGKSTLLQHLNGILRGDGSVEVGGLRVTDESLPLIRAKVGLVFQNPDDQLFSPTVFDDVAYGPLYMGLPAEEIKDRVGRALAAVDMSGFEDRMPHHLSIGERKRIAVATVLSMDPEILALDEPSAGLDPRTRRGLIALLRGLPETLIASTHDMHLVRDLFDRTIVMHEGRIVVDAPTPEVLVDEDLLLRYGLEAP